MVGVVAVSGGHGEHKVTQDIMGNLVAGDHVKIVEHEQGQARQHLVRAGLEHGKEGKH